MDLLGEASSGSRVLTARHISVEKSLPLDNKAVNTTLLCHSYDLQPDIRTYVAALHPYAWVLWSCGFLVLLATCLLYGVTLRLAARHWKGYMRYIAVIVAVYPVISAASFVVLVVPRARLVAEAVAQQAVMLAMYQLFCMLLTECGGREKLARSTEAPVLETRVPPCCCWPCCVIPRPKLTVRTLSWLRWLVLQMPIVQGLIYIIILILWSESMQLYLNAFIYIQPFVAASILSGVWGMIMCVRAVESAGRTPRPRFLALQLALIIIKLQCGLVKSITDIFNLPCVMNLHPFVFVNMIQSGVTMLEMLLLSLWAWRLYRVAPCKVGSIMPQVVVAVLDDSDLKAIKDVPDRHEN